MEATKLTEEIYKNYLKVWTKIKDYLIKIGKDFGYNKGIQFTDHEAWIFFYNNSIFTIKITFPILFSLLEEFFFSNNIIIDIYPSRSFKNPWTYNIYDQNIDKIFFIHQAEVLDFQFEEKDIAKYHAIIKACKILEERLK